MAFLNAITNLIGAAEITPLVTAPNAMWHILILKAFGWIGDYGWSIVVFTVLLKLVLSPLDFYQRYKMNKNQKITERLKPTMEKIQKQCGGDKQAFSQRQMELNRKEGYSYFSSCLPMIVTMVVFITLWLSMNTVAQYMTLKEYTNLYDEFETVYEQVYSDLGDEAAGAKAEGSEYTLAERIGQDVVYKLYYDGINDDYVKELRETYGLSDSFDLESKGKIQASFLWIDNIWAPDVPWGNKSILTWDEFTKSIDDYKNADENGLGSEVTARVIESTMYNKVMYKLLNDNPKSDVNGYLILPILVVLLSVGSQLLSSFQQKRAGQVNAKGGMATSMKVMMFVMPVMMAIFAIQYASIFTMYMVTNTATTLFFNFLFTTIIKLVDKRKQNRHYGISTGSPRTITYKQSPIVHYIKGSNPDAGKRIVPQAETSESSGASGAETKEEKKNKRKKTPQIATVKRSGRPDPNDLMGIDMRTPDSKKKK